MTSTNTQTTSTQKASIVAGISLLSMAIIAPLANFGAIQPLILEGHATKTASDILASDTVFMLGITGMVLVSVLDIVAAWALYLIFKPAHRVTALVMGWLRIIYAGILLAATGFLAHALQLFHSGNPHQGLAQINNFQDFWSGGLIVFGLHLIMLGYLSYKATYSPKFIGALLVLAGLGYFIDNIGKLFLTHYGLSLTSFAFIGEVVLIVWLLGWGRKINLDEHA